MTTTTDYEWDYRNRLTKITDKDFFGATTNEVEYHYDIFDRRIAKVIDDQTTVDTEYFVYDGQHIALRLDEDGAVANRYLHGPAVDQILADEQVSTPGAAGDVLWTLTDNLGSVRDVVNYDATTDTSTVVNHIVYDSFGNIRSETNATVDVIFGFTGRETDEESGLYYYRARYYDPAIGQFVSEDPIGFAAGDSNLRRYVGNSPTNATDPSGMWAAPGSDGISDAAWENALRQVSDLTNWTASRQGHHWIPQSVYKALGSIRGFMAPAVAKYFSTLALDPKSYNHGFERWAGVSHYQYNRAMMDVLREFRRVTCGRAPLQIAEAERFARFITDPNSTSLASKLINVADQLQDVRRFQKGFLRSVVYAGLLREAGHKLFQSDTPSPELLRQRKHLLQELVEAGTRPEMSRRAKDAARLSAENFGGAKNSRRLGRAVGSLAGKLKVPALIGVLTTVWSFCEGAHASGSTSARLIADGLDLETTRGQIIAGLSEAGYDAVFGEEVEGYLFPRVEDVGNFWGDFFGVGNGAHSRRIQRAIGEIK